MKCTVEEVLATINNEINPIKQNLLENEQLLHHIQVSNNLGWQVPCWSWFVYRNINKDGAR
jgi:hypothetical protein